MLFRVLITFMIFSRLEEQKTEDSATTENTKNSKKEDEDSTKLVTGHNKFSHLDWDEFKKSKLPTSFLDLEKSLASLMESQKKFFADREKAFQSHFAAVNQSIEARQREIFDSPGRFLQSTLPVELKSLPKKLSWKKFGSFPAEDQKDCAACYVFSALAAVEIVINRHFDINLSLSKQEVIDCSKKNKGCESGNPFNTLDYIYQNGVADGPDYPYRNSQLTCSLPQKHEARFFEKIKVTKVPSSVISLIIALNRGPIAILHSVNKELKDYIKGVVPGTNCTGPIDHSSTLVGYDLTAKVPFFEFRNSWGADFGENGHYRMAIGPLTHESKGTCRLVDHIAIALVELP